MKQLLIAVVTVLATEQAFAQPEPSEVQQRLACMGDALRLCPQYIPNRDQIIQCLSSQHDALSSGCRPVFDASLKALIARRRHRS